MVDLSSWVMGYLEVESTIGVYINLIEKPNGKRYVILKPYIHIQVKDDEVAQYIKSTLAKNTKISVGKHEYKKKVKLLNAIRIQNFDDIDRIIAIIADNKFVSSYRQMTYDRFLKAYERIKKIGATWKEWDPALDDFIDDCLPIQDNKKGFTNEEWKKRVRVHFSGEKEKE